MKYNNIIFLGLCLGLTTYSALSADSVIKISGRVLDYGCTVSSDSLNFTVDLQKNSARQFPTTGSTSPAVPFQITLSECSKGTTGVRGSASGWHNITLSLTDCPVETSAVTAIVTGSTDNTGYYKNEGTAENIQIELRDDQDAALKNGDSKTVIVDEITRNAQFPLKARAITVNGNASQGTIEALINVIYTWQ
ncbi:fimbrial protein [Escherichia coli]|uniref:fimbrial protein n=2 Tax=Escherichia coli TaxID=562 RepID=UPI00202BA833|nr:fimbrial protein [Escherichia coli]